MRQNKGVMGAIEINGPLRWRTLVEIEFFADFSPIFSVFGLKNELFGQKRDFSIIRPILSVIL